MGKSPCKLLLVFVVCCYINGSIAQERPNDKYIKYYNPWEKAVIVEGHINALLPYDLSKMQSWKSSSQNSSLISVDTKTFGESFTYKSLPIELNLNIKQSINLYPEAFTHYTNNNNHPTTWDMSDLETVFCEEVGGAISIGYRQYKLERIWDNSENASKHLFLNRYTKCITYDRYENPINRLKYVEQVVIDGETIHRPIPITPDEGLFFCTDCNDDKTLNLYVLNFAQVHVCNGTLSAKSKQDNEVWKYQYAFKMPRTSHFEVCRIWNDLYILTNDYGICKLDIVDAKKNAPEQPKNAFEKWGDTNRFIWGGFKEKHIVENKVKAEKISDLNYDRYVVDKDSNTAYIISDGYLYELDNLKIRAKIPELRKTENFIDAEAEYMRAVLEAIYNLGRKPETTPAALLKVTPDSEIDNKLAEENANASNPNGNANGGADDDRTETDPNSKNGNANDNTSNNSDDSSNNGNGSANSDSQNTDANGDNNSNNENSDNVNKKSGNAMDGSNFAIYAGGGLIVLILITVIFIVLSRRKH